MNAMDLRRGINMAVEAVVEHLKSKAKMISTSEEIAQVSDHWNHKQSLILG
jgi:chaperonin GroEL